MIDPLSALPAAIRAVAPGADAGTWATALAPVMRSSGITTPNRIAMFLGQISEETGGLRVFEEDLDYETASRICEVWPSRFPTEASAAPFVRNPEGLANRVYANREGNGDEASGDGWRFRGRGAIQLTFRDAYAQFARAMGRPLDDALLAWMLTPAGAAASACWSWTSIGHLNALADAWDVVEVTIRVNGGTGNLATREALCEAARAVLVPASLGEARSENAETPGGNHQNPAIPAAFSHDLAPEEITPESAADRLMDAELKQLNPAPEQS